MRRRHPPPDDRRTGISRARPIDDRSGRLGTDASAQKPSANLASSVIISGDQGGSKTIFGWTAVTPWRSPTNSFICSETWGPIGQAGVVRVKVT